MNDDWKYLFVALLVSAWIEITTLDNKLLGVLVALLVSAWIEIRVSSKGATVAGSRTPCECVD